MRPVRAPTTENPVRAIVSAFCAVLIGVGLARFAYAPLVPALISDGWLESAQAGYIGAANFAGYLAGAVIAASMARRMGTTSALRIMMFVGSASFFVCAAPWPFYWFFAFRFASGLSGGVLMVLAATTVLPLVAPDKRGLASGVIFTAVGLGIVIAGAGVPLLLGAGLFETWMALGVVSTLAAVAGWKGWPTQPGPVSAPIVSPPSVPNDRIKIAALLVTYFLTAVALVPHMVFLVDYATRGLHLGMGVGGMYWVLFGIGALLGPVCAGWLGDQVGNSAALKAVLVVEVVAIMLPVAGGDPLLLGLSSVLVGAFVPGVVPLMLGMIQEVARSPVERRKAWASATIAFAAGQAAGGFFFSFIFAQSDGSYRLLFTLAAAVLTLSLLGSVFARSTSRRPGVADVPSGPEPRQFAKEDET